MKNLSLFFLSLSMIGMSTHSLYAHKHPDVIVVQQPVIVQQPVVVEPNYVIVESEPPAEIVETIPTCPGSTYYWKKGRWAWNNGWKWTSGSWIARPTAQAEWVPGYWVKHHHRHGWYWIEGHWQ